jgi:hypothetical protein
VDRLQHWDSSTSFCERFPLPCAPDTDSGPAPFLIAMKALIALLVAGDTDALVHAHPALNGVRPTKS